MKIWMINHYAAPPSMAGGTRHYNFARQLIQRGHEVTLIAANYNHFSHTFMASGIDQYHSVPFVWIPTPAYRGNTVARFQNKLSFSGKLLRKKYLPRHTPPDIIIGSSPHLFAALGGELLARWLKVPSLLEIRDLWPESLVDLGRISPRHPVILLMRRIEKYLYKRAKGIITLLPSAEQYLVANGVKPQNIVWLPNAVDMDALPVDLEKIPAKHFTFMYAGAHGLANDLDTVIHAAKILQDAGKGANIRIVLVGSGPEKPGLKTLSANLGVSIVDFREPVSKKDIYVVLNEADAFLMLLEDSPVFRWGISPNKLFDYLVMKRPVIFGVNTPFNPIEQYQAGISIKPSDPAALANAMEQLSCLPNDEREQMGLRGKEFVMQHHHLPRLTDALEEMLQKYQP